MSHRQQGGTRTRSLTTKVRDFFSTVLEYILLSLGIWRIVDHADLIAYNERLIYRMLMKVCTYGRRICGCLASRGRTKSDTQIVNVILWIIATTTSPYIGIEFASVGLLLTTALSFWVDVCQEGRSKCDFHSPIDKLIKAKYPMRDAERTLEKAIMLKADEEQYGCQFVQCWSGMVAIMLTLFVEIHSLFIQYPWIRATYAPSREV